jgi:hypothetical protein
MMKFKKNILTIRDKLDVVLFSLALIVLVSTLYFYCGGLVGGITLFISLIIAGVGVELLDNQEKKGD